MPSEQTEAARRLRRRAIWLTGALAIAAVLAGAALLFAQRAQASATEARSIALAASAETAMRDGNVDLALALVLAANDLASPPAFARRVLYDVGLAPGAARQIVAEAAGAGLWT